MFQQNFLKKGQILLTSFTISSAYRVISGICAVVGPGPLSVLLERKALANRQVQQDENENVKTIFWQCVSEVTKRKLKPSNDNLSGILLIFR